jgi:hypothetical protein
MEKCKGDAEKRVLEETVCMYVWMVDRWIV